MNSASQAKFTRNYENIRIGSYRKSKLSIHYIQRWKFVQINGTVLNNLWFNKCSFKKIRSLSIIPSDARRIHNSRGRWSDGSESGFHSTWVILPRCFSKYGTISLTWSSFSIRLSELTHFDINREACFFIAYSNAQKENLMYLRLISSMYLKEFAEIHQLFSG
jgi:hypothetical protein